MNLLADPTQLGKLQDHSHTLLSHVGEIRDLESFLLTLSCSSSLGKEIQVRWRHFPYPVHESKLTFFFFFPSSAVLELLLWKPGLSRKDSALWVTVCDKWWFQRLLDCGLRDARAGSGAAAGTTVRTDIWLPFAWCLCVRGTSWVPWPMVSRLSPRSKEGLSVDGYPIFVVGSGAKTIKVLCHHAFSWGFKIYLV